MTSRNGKGAASAAPTITGVKGLAQEPSVLNWVRARTRAGVPTKTIIQETRAGAHGWPFPGQMLSDGSLASCRAAIAIVERLEREWPLEDVPVPREREAGKRLRLLNEKRKEQDGLLIRARIDIQKAVERLEIIDFGMHGLRDADQDTIMAIHEELSLLSSWLDEALGTVTSFMDNLHLHRRLEKLDAMSTRNGCSPGEMANAMRLADRLRSRLAAKAIGA